MRVNVPRKIPAKPALTLDEQIARLRERGLTIGDKDRARHYLGHLNYYRLRGYWMRWEVPNHDGEHRFRAGSSFADVIRLYDFDRRLRLELNDAVARVEVSLRTRWAYVLGLHAGCVAHRDPDLFNGHHRTLLGGVERLYADRKEAFLWHYLDRGEEPPIWALCEVLSLGSLSKWVRSIRSHRLRAEIVEPYGIHETPFCSFVQHLAYVRNVCAHHGRLWNHDWIVGTLALPKKPAELVAQLQQDPDSTLRIYNTLALLGWLMRIVSPGSEWRQRVRTLLCERPDLWTEMGVPYDWRGFDLWGEAHA